MRMRTARLPLALAVLATAVSPAAAQTNFSVYVSVGDSLAAGFSSGSLVESHQANSVPALIARQAAVAGFQQPLVSQPGIPPELALVTLAPTALIAPRATTPGAPRNLELARPYNNLAVPGARAADALTTTAGGLHDLVLRGLGSQVAQAVALRPTVVTVWIGNNDVLGAATSGRAIEGVTLTPAAAFRASFQQIISTLRNTGAFVVAANLPDVTAIPFVTTIKPYLVNPTTGQPVLVNGQRVPLIGPAGPLPENAFVLLTAGQALAQGVGIPTAAGGRGTPLGDEHVLDAGEAALIRDRVRVNNDAIREICNAAGARLLDVHALLDEFATSGRRIAGITLTAAFLTGGVFSYDAVHPSDLGYAVIANEWIRVINEAGGELPELDLLPFLGLASAGSGAQAASARGASGPPELSAAAEEQILSLFLPPF
jgi:lysophospholipase L1-like esterase